MNFSGIKDLLINAIERSKKPAYRAEDPPVIDADRLFAQVAAIIDVISIEEGFAVRDKSKEQA